MSFMTCNGYETNFSTRECLSAVDTQDRLRGFKAVERENTSEVGFSVNEKQLAVAQ